MVQETLDRPTYSVQLTDAAVAKVTQLLEREEPGLALQISVQPGGCSGMRYQLFFTDKYAKALSKILAQRDDEGFAEEDDAEASAQRAALVTDKVSVVWFSCFAVVIDPLSGPYLDNAIIDYLDTLQKSGFVIDNPHAGGSCACGDSFRQ
ncbi:HesB/IscA family protein [Streptomyces sp. NPDC088560]|uniref:HesB/IscA family protein n=1 Tax=Streptomyces sp. NPDC088560 TaxID=3365868 RepID=UPI0038278C9B